jgi:hypothetical protein
MKISHRIIPSVLPLLCLTFGLASSKATADVLWQHDGKVSLAGEQLMSFKMYNAWSGDNHKSTIKLDASKIAGMAGARAAGKPTQFEVSLIQRLGDDRILVSSPDAKTYIDEPYSTLKSRLRFNLWEGIDEELAKEETIPELTPAQRQRLGKELRASASLITKRITRNYFRALPQKRTIQGLETRGYRYTTKFNIATQPRQQEWISISSELWMAPTADNDSEITSFVTRANALHKASGPATVSMWSNEMFPVLWEAAPKEFHTYFGKLAGNIESENFGFVGTPVQFFVTVSPPPAQKLAVGDLRFSLELTKRATSPLGTAMFEAPAGYRHQKIEPMLQMLKNMQREALATFSEAMDGDFGGFMGMGGPTAIDPRTF